MTVSSIHNALVVKQPQNPQKQRKINKPVAFTANNDINKKPQKLSIVKSLGSGFIQPVKDIFSAVINAPLSSFVILGATAAAMRVSKLFAGVLTVGIAGYGACKTAVNTVRATKAIKEAKGKDEADYTKANAYIKEVGEGLFDVALTANAAIESVKAFVGSTKALTGVKGATIEQKIYAAAKQLQKPQEILDSPKTFSAIGKSLKEESMAEIAKLKTIFTKKPSSDVTSKLAEVVKTGKATKEQIISALKDISETMGDKSGKINQIIKQLQKTDKITSLGVNDLVEIESLIDSIDTAKEAPAAVKILRSVMGKADDVARLIKKRVTSIGEGGAEAAKIASHSRSSGELAAAGISTAELSEGPDQMTDGNLY